MIPKNSIELQNDMNNKMSTVIHNVSMELTEALKNIINDTVYDAYSPTWYTRTYEFLESWECTAPTIVGNYITSNIEQTTLRGNWNKDLFQHGNDYEALPWSNLNNIIERGLSNEPYRAGFHNINSRPFWTEFMIYCDTNMGRLIREEFQKVGLHII